MSIDARRFGGRVMAVLLAAATLAGCAQAPSVEPDGTTYPRDRNVRVTQQMAIGVPGVSIPINTTVQGDKAEVETFIRPRSMAELPEGPLLARIPETGRRLCGGEYRVSESHYYYGSEATLRVLSIDTPALRVLFRCPVTDQTGTGFAQKLDRLPRQFEDRRFFDSLWKDYPMPPDRLLAGFRRFLAQKQMPIVADGTIAGEAYVIAGRDPNDMRWGRIERVSAIIGGGSARAQLAMKHFSYQFTYHKRGVFDSERPSELRGAQPMDRKTAYARATAFLAEFEASLNAR